MATSWYLGAYTHGGTLRGRRGEMLASSYSLKMIVSVAELVEKKRRIT